MSQNFSRERRIVKTDDFSSVFRLRPKNRTGHFTLYARGNTLQHARLGLVVAKRLAQRAVTRNMIKRVCREVFRKKALDSMDYIVRLSASVVTRRNPATGVQLKRLVKKELEQLFAGETQNRES
ncbi:ribonuclease P protein component [Oxalobacter vibrioformis]|uniref:Ribonuclease P protein component n=1 Tax=Oxalobacter vibrioformis TaxID=933080 RepID=A0A9E9P282_9BURK|nr:ribonuclease P protein component [Oxalobacter vibrioformis]WAW08940.1 ribonuclease P protein component [Oxalobacter vibrioformis]